MNLTSLFISALILASDHYYPAENHMVDVSTNSFDAIVAEAGAGADNGEDAANQSEDSASAPASGSPDLTMESAPGRGNVCNLCCPESWRVSTNLLAWGMAIANVGVECDLAGRWSAALSLYYSGWNYLKDTRKFRTFTVRPEARYWFSRGHRGFFVEGHFQLAYYNFALPSWSYRIQDRDGKHPALGGGIGAGFRLPLGTRWAVGAQVGAGIYHLSYDRFENRPDGPLHDTRSRTWLGIDNLSVGISFNFK